MNKNRDKEEHAPRTVENALTPEQIQANKQQKMEELNQQENEQREQAPQE